MSEALLEQNRLPFPLLSPLFTSPSPPSLSPSPSTLPPTYPSILYVYIKFSAYQISNARKKKKEKKNGERRGKNKKKQNKIV
jgi:hypothetical protein